MLSDNNKNKTKESEKNKMKIDKKPLLLGILIGAMVTGAPFLYILATSPSNPFYLSPGVYPGGPSYTIWKDGSDYFAKDANGLIQYFDDDASEVINDAVDSLTAGRTWKDKVFLKGSILLTNPIILPSYVSLQFEDLTASSSLTGNMIEATNQTNIEITGGVLDGQSYPNAGIFLNFVSDIKIYNVKAKNFTGDGISVSNCTGADLFSPLCEYCKMRGIYIVGSMYVNVYGGIVQFCSDGLGVGTTSAQVKIHGTIAKDNAYYYAWGSGMFAANAAWGVEFIGVSCYGNDNGLEIDDTGDVAVIGGVFYENDDSGIAIYGSDCKYIRIDGVYCINNGVAQNATKYSCGLFLSGATYNIIVGSHFIDNQATHTQQHGIKEYDTSNFNMIISCHTKANVVAGIRTLGGATYTRVSWNNTGWIT